MYLKIGTCYKKKCKKCLEAENFPLTDLLFYILKILDPYRYKSSHLTMQVSTIKKCGMYFQIKVKILILSQLIHYYLYCEILDVYKLKSNFKSASTPLQAW